MSTTVHSSPFTVHHFGKAAPYPGPEEELQKATARWLRLAHPALLAFHVPNGGKRPLTPVKQRGGGVRMVPAIGKAMKDGGALAGVSDWLILQPSGPYHGAAIELKAKGGSLQDTQKDFLQKATDNHYFSAVAWSLDGFMEAVGYFLNQVLK
jgi:hypothetical protein